MSGIVTFGKLQPADRGLAVRALFLVTTIRIALWVMPFRLLRRFAAFLERVPFSVPADTPVTRLEWAIRAAGRRIPAASCLTQSFALQCLMARSGRRSQIHIGVAKDPQKGFQAHAWVEYEGNTLLSGPDEAGRYVRLMVVEDGEPVRR